MISARPSRWGFGSVSHHSRLVRDGETVLHSDASGLLYRTITLRLFTVLISAGLLSVLLAAALDGIGLNLLQLGTLDLPRHALIFWPLLLGVAMFTPQLFRERWGIAVVLPFMTQFSQVAMGWEIAGGPHSLLRIAPYLALAVFLAAEAWRERPAVKHAERALVGICLGFAALGTLGGLVAKQPAAFAAMALGLGLPALTILVRHHTEQSPEFSAWITSALGLSFVGLAIGSLGIIKVSSGFELGGVTGLLATRNVSDYNLILGYLILLWPFAVRWGLHWGGALVGGLVILLIGTSVLGLSRVGLAVLPILGIIGLWMAFDHARSQGHGGRTLLQMLGTMVAVGVAISLIIPQRDSLGLVWSQRLNIASIDQILTLTERVRPGGEDSQARDMLRAEAVRLWQAEPWIGHGFGGFDAYSVRGFSDAHSLTLTVLAEHGLLGLAVLYVALIALALRLLGLARVGLRRDLVLMMSCLVAWLLAGHTVGTHVATWTSKSFAVGLMTAILLILWWHAPRWWAGLPVSEEQTGEPA